MNSENIFNIICENTKEVIYELEDQEIKRSDSLANLGANSVDRSEIIMMTLESLNLQIPLVDTFGPKNIGELADLLASKM